MTRLTGYVNLLAKIALPIFVATLLFAAAARAATPDSSTPVVKTRAGVLAAYPLANDVTPKQDVAGYESDFAKAHHCDLWDSIAR